MQRWSSLKESRGRLFDLSGDQVESSHTSLGGGLALPRASCALREGRHLLLRMSLGRDWARFSLLRSRSHSEGHQASLQAAADHKNTMSSQVGSLLTYWQSSNERIRSKQVIGQWEGSHWDLWPCFTVCNMLETLSIPVLNSVAVQLRESGQWLSTIKYTNRCAWRQNSYFIPTTLGMN